MRFLLVLLVLSGLSYFALWMADVNGYSRFEFSRLETAAVVAAILAVGMFVGWALEDSNEWPKAEGVFVFTTFGDSGVYHRDVLCRNWPDTTEPPIKMDVLRAESYGIQPCSNCCLHSKRDEPSASHRPC